MSVKSNISSEEYGELVIRLKTRQNNHCFICAEILADTCITHVDHIKPRSTGGKDDENNYAITHKACNESKQDTDLEIARRLHILKKIQKNTPDETVSLEHVLKYFNGSSDILNFKIDEKNKVFKTSIDGIYEKEYTIFEDSISDESSVILEIPIKYLYFDKYINPRPVNILNIGKLTKEFYKKKSTTSFGFS